MAPLTIAQRYLDALGALDADRLRTLLSPDYEHTFGPSSAELGPAIDADAFVARFAALHAVLVGLPFEILRSWASDADRTITIFAASAPKFHEHVKRPSQDDEGEWTFRGEYVFVLTLDDAGEKVAKAFEFVDANAVNKMKTQIGKAFQRASSDP